MRDLLMSDSLDRVRGISELPLFPLPLVLFPGVPLPLHIFEPRYRQMLREVRAGTGFFGLSYFDGNAVPGADRPRVGHVGCAAEVAEVQPLDDGRSNILAVGLIRYRLEGYVEGDEPYLIGRVSFFEDEAEDEEVLVARGREVLETFMRIARAVRTINDERASLPELHESEPEHLSFLIAAAMEIEVEVKQELLELRVTSERLKRLHRLLTRVVDGYEERARMHTVAKGNGHSRRNIDFEP